MYSPPLVVFRKSVGNRDGVNVSSIAALIIILIPYITKPRVLRVPPVKSSVHLFPVSPLFVAQLLVLSELTPVTLIYGLWTA